MEHDAVKNKELLDKVEAAITARLDGGAVQSYSIGGRNIQYIGLSELIKLRDELRRNLSVSGGKTTYAEFKELA
jgi:hypothetical protein